MYPETFKMVSSVSFNPFHITVIIYDHLCKDDCWNWKINQDKECKKKKKTLWIMALEVCTLRILNCFKIYGLNYDRIHKFWFDHNNSDSYIELNIRLCS